jgi:hypothetical protein
MGNPLTSRPSRAVAISTVSIVGIGLALSATRVGPLLAFTVPPPTFFLFLAGATVTYLALVEVVKRVACGVWEFRPRETSFRCSADLQVGRVGQA